MAYYIEHDFPVQQLNPLSPSYGHLSGTPREGHTNHR